MCQVLCDKTKTWTRRSGEGLFSSCWNIVTHWPTNSKSLVFLDTFVINTRKTSEKAFSASPCPCVCLVAQDLTHFASAHQNCFPRVDHKCVKFSSSRFSSNTPFGLVCYVRRPVRPSILGTWPRDKPENFKRKRKVTDGSTVVFIETTSNIPMPP